MQADNPNQNPAAPDPDPAAPPQSVETQLQAHVAALEAKAAEHYDALLRAKAEGENIRKRAQEDIGKAHKYAVESFAQEMIPVRDSLEMALATMATPTATLESLRAGVELTLKQLTAAFEKSSLREVNRSARSSTRIVIRRSRRCPPRNRRARSSRCGRRVICSPSVSCGPRSLPWRRPRNRMRRRPPLEFGRLNITRGTSFSNHLNQAKKED